MDKVTVELGPGDAVLADPGVEHNLVNTGSIPLRILVITDPAKPDDQGTA
jgi:mannose-6-phosphate isomerase-like protein (cupin superfamily)